MYHHRAEGEEEEYISQSSSTTPDFDAEEEEEEEADDDDDDDDDEESAMYGRFGKRERRIEHYTSSQRILLVGEGDFSFSLSLAKAFSSARNMVSTSIDTQQDLFKKYSNGVGNVRDLEEKGCVVLHGVDATKMSQHYFLTTQRFDRIVYNFPHVGFLFPEGNGCQIKLNKQLIKGFLRNAKMLLKEGGEIHISHKDGEPYDKWDLVKKAKKISLALHESVPFCKDKYPGYGNKRAHGRFSDAPFLLGDCTTYKFKLAHSCQFAWNGK
jgi:25S rRNA (uracil2634-N3)-methyltransferase